MMKIHQNLPVQNKWWTNGNYTSTSTIEYMVAHVQTSGKTKCKCWRYVCGNFKRWKILCYIFIKKLGIQRVDILEEFQPIKKKMKINMLKMIMILIIKFR